MVEIHFISTGPFRYLHMIAVMTAALMQCAERINVYFTDTLDKSNPYIERISNYGKVKTHSLNDIPEYPALVGQSDAFVRAHLKDILMWEILVKKGGICLDLDVISLQSITGLFDQTSAIASLDSDENIAFPFNSSIAGFRLDHDPVARWVKSYVDGKAGQPNMCWGDTGPIAISLAATAFPNVFKKIPRSMLNPYGGNESHLLYEEGGQDRTAKMVHLYDKANPAKMVHLYAKANPVFDQIDAEWIKKSNSPLARIVKSFPKDVWDFPKAIPAYSATAYLNQRGCHYAKLLEELSKSPITKIMEIGTSSGFTAVEMIRHASMKHNGNESVIKYYGVDLFEALGPLSRDVEFTGNYLSNKENAAKYITENTKAQIHLIAGNSTSKTVRDQIMSYWPEMDLIYIDGGHSIPTVIADWNLAMSMIAPNGVIIFDDYFSEMPFIGCKTVIDNVIDKNEWDVQISEEKDEYAHPFGHLTTQLVIVKRHPEMKSWAAEILEKIKEHE